MIGITIKDGASPVLNAASANMQSALERGVLQAAQMVAGEIRRSIFARHPGGKGGLARSFKPSVLLRSKGQVSMGVFSDAVHAGIQDRGGTIFPRVRKYLAIPFPGAGVPMGKWPRHFGADELTLIVTRSGKRLLVKKTGKDGFKPMFILKPQVTIRGSHYLEAAKRSSQGQVVAILGGQVRLAVREAGKAG